jgi:hypothetical protein
LVVVNLPEIMASVGDHLMRKVALAEHRVAGDDTPFEGQILQQFEGGFVLVGLGVNTHLAEDAAGPLVHRREQMDRRVVWAEAATRGLAVEGGAGEFGGSGLAEYVGDPTGQSDFESLGVEPREQRLEGPIGGWSAAIAELVHQFDGLIAAPLGDCGIASATAEHGAAGVRQHGDQRVSLAMA